MLKLDPEDANVRLPTVAAGSAGSLTAPVDYSSPRAPTSLQRGPVTSAENLV